MPPVPHVPQGNLERALDLAVGPEGPTTLRLCAALISAMPWGPQSVSPTTTPAAGVPRKVDPPAVAATPPPAKTAECKPCNAFREISHVHGLLLTAADSCGPEGLPMGVGGTVHLAGRETDKIIRSLAGEPQYAPTLILLEELRPMLNWVGDCAQAQAVADKVSEALRQCHSDTLSTFIGRN